MQSPEDKLREFEAAESAEKDRPVSDRYPFKIDVTDRRGNRWTGEFVAKAPTMYDLIQIGRLKASYLPQGAADDPIASGTNEMVCHLAVVLVEKPSWWKPLEFHDSTPLIAVYEEVTAFERKFLGADQNHGAEPREAPERRAEPVDDQAPVGRKVRPTAERSETIVSNRS